MNMFLIQPILDEDAAFREAARVFWRERRSYGVLQFVALVTIGIPVSMIVSPLSLWITGVQESLRMDVLGSGLVVMLSWTFSFLFILRKRSSLLVDFARKLSGMPARERIREAFGMEPAEFAAHAAVFDIFSSDMFDKEEQADLITRQSMMEQEIKAQM